MPDNQIPDVRLFRDKINWKWIIFLLIVFRFVVIPVFLYFKENSNKAPNQSSRSSNTTPCVSLPDNFDEIELPAQVGCWRLKLDPNKFSGKVWFPRDTKINYRWETEGNDHVYQIKNKFGEIFTIDPRIENRMGKDNKALQFKGIGYVKIYITRIWSPMRQF